MLSGNASSGIFRLCRSRIVHAHFNSSIKFTRNLELLQLPDYGLKLVLYFRHYFRRRLFDEFSDY